MPPTFVFLAVVLLITGGLFALVFVGPVFAVIVMAIAALLFWVFAALSDRPDSGIATGERPRALRRFAGILFLLSVIISVVLQGYLYWNSDACESYDWLDGTVDGRCNPMIHAITGADSGLPVPTPAHGSWEAEAPQEQTQ